MTPAEVYTRRASGLVRQASTLDVFAVSMAASNIGIAAFWMIILGPAFYNGSDMVLSSLLVGIIVLPILYAYYLVAVIMPRSGGDYVFISRGLMPVLGFVFTFQIFWWYVYYCATSASWTSTMGLSPMLVTLGSQINNSSITGLGLWAASPVGTFVIGSAALIFVFAVLIIGLKPLLWVNVVSNLIAYVGTVVVIALLLGSSSGTFISRFNEVMAPQIGATYDQVIAAARSSGWSNPGFSLDQTLRLMIWPYWACGWTFLCVGFAGEVRSIRRSQWVGIVGVSIVDTVLVALLAAVAVSTMGYDFLGAISYNFYVTPGAATTPVLPGFAYLAQVLTDSPLVTLLINFGWMMWGFLWLPSIITYVSRVSFSWAIDHILPDGLSKVSDRFHSPVRLTLLCFVMAEIFLAVYVFTPYLVNQTGVFASLPSFAVLGIAAVAFPYGRYSKRIFEESPVSRRILGVPILSIAGALGAASMIYLGYFFATDAIAGAASPSSLISIAIGFVLAICIYYAAVAYRKRQGIDLTLMFREIPVE